MLIAKVLEMPASELLGEKSKNVIHHNNGDNAQAYIKTIRSDKNHIESLKEEIAFLREVRK